MDRCFPIFVSWLTIAWIAAIAGPPLFAQEETRAPWRAHDTTRPRPAIITPPTGPGQPPSDAIILFDGTDISPWESTDGHPTKWTVSEGCLICRPESGPLRTKAGFGDIQLHAEWAAPTPPKGKSQGRGNSGIYFMSKYEVQVLDSYENETYADGQAASMYGQNPPMVNVCRPPGEWQTYDIIFRRPRFTEDGDLESPAVMTVIHNGVVVQDHFELWGPTNWLKNNEYEPHPDRLPIMLQDHGNPVRYRNIWLRPLPPQPAYTTMAVAKPQVELTEDQLDRLAGQYDDVTIHNSPTGLQLELFSRRFDLVPQSPLKFEMKQTHGDVSFVETNGKITSMKFNLMGNVDTKARTMNNPNQPDPVQPSATNTKPSFDASDYVGLTEEAAVARAEKEGRRCRIIQRDDQSFPATRDYRPNRVNLTIKSGKVTEARGG